MMMAKLNLQVTFSFTTYPRRFNGAFRIGYVTGYELTKQSLLHGTARSKQCE